MPMAAHAIVHIGRPSMTAAAAAVMAYMAKLDGSSAVAAANMPGAKHSSASVHRAAASEACRCTDLPANNASTSCSRYEYVRPRLLLNLDDD